MDANKILRLILVPHFPYLSSLVVIFLLGGCNSIHIPASEVRHHLQKQEALQHTIPVFTDISVELKLDPLLIHRIQEQSINLSTQVHFRVKSEDSLLVSEAQTPLQVTGHVRYNREKHSLVAEDLALDLGPTDFLPTFLEPQIRNEVLNYLSEQLASVELAELTIKKPPQWLDKRSLSNILYSDKEQFTLLFEKP